MEYTNSAHPLDNCAFNPLDRAGCDYDRVSDFISSLETRFEVKLLANYGFDGSPCWADQIVRPANISCTF